MGLTDRERTRSSCQSQQPGIVHPTGAEHNEPVVNARRAEAAHTQLVALRDSASDVDDVQAAVIEIVRRVVPFDAACWATVDPDTMMFTGSMTVEFEPTEALEQRFVEIESAGDDVNSFRDLATRRSPIGRLSDAGPAAIEASDRFQDIWAPIGVGHELRAAFSVANRCWAVAGMLRSSDSGDFTDAEVDFLASAGSTIGAATRAALLRTPRGGVLTVNGSAVVLLHPDGSTMSMTPAARDLLESTQLASRTGRLALRSLSSAVQHGAPSARAQLHDDDHGWLLLDASPLSGIDQHSNVVVTITPASPRDVTSLLLDAHGLSPREQEVVTAVLAGLSTTDIAARLYISSNTVQDHLKAVFHKIGVHSRRELTAYFNGTTPN